MIFMRLPALLLVVSTNSASAGTILETRSRSFTIVDDGDRLAAELVDNIPVDTYVYHPGSKNKRISVITDADEHSFIFERGKTIDFQINYQGRLYPQRLVPVEPHKWDGPDNLILPFQLGPNNSILIDASVNGSPPIKLLFDTGASVSVLNVHDVKLEALLKGLTGDIRLGDLRIRRTPIIGIDYNGSLKADGVLGYNVFLGRQVAIDYGRREMRIGAPVSQPPEGFRTMPLIWRGGHSLVMVGVNDGRNSRQLPMVFDTGSKYAVSLSNRDPLAEEATRLHTFGWRVGSKSDGKRVLSRVFNMPSVSLAGFVMFEVQADIETPSEESILAIDILGNDFLKRFDLIIDYQSGQVHVRPNGLASSPYNEIWLSDRMLLTLGALLSMVLIIAVIKMHKRCNFGIHAK